MESDIFKNYKGLFENSFNQLLAKENNTSVEKILEIMYLMMYREKIDEDILILYKLLNMEDFIKLFLVLGGKTIKFETKDKINDYLILSLIYYYKEIKGLTLKDIQKKLPFNLCKGKYRSYGIRIKNFNKELKNNINKILET